MNFPKLTLDIIYEAEELLSSVKYFNVENNEARRNEFKQRFFNTISILNDEERELFYVLSKKFISINPGMLDETLYKSSMLLKEKLNKNVTIFVLPVLTEYEHENSINKSGHQIVFMMKGIFAEIFDDQDYNVEFLLSPKGLEMHMDRKESIILFCDDFIGSGDQFYSSYSFYKQYSKFDDKCAVISIAILESGHNNISKLNIDIYSEFMLKKGISDNANINDKAEALRIIDLIEEKLHVDIDYRRGFNGSEALIAINRRAPDNTFPIFWWKYNEKKAIFARK